jgi:hypothetical protein
MKRLKIWKGSKRKKAETRQSFDLCQCFGLEDNFNIFFTIPENRRGINRKKLQERKMILKLRRFSSSAVVGKTSRTTLGGMGHLSWIGVGQILFEFLLSLVLYELL